MDKLIITVTVDSTMSYPGNPRMPPIEDTDAVADEYVRSVDAGASLVHHHGVHYLDAEMQADGRKLSRTNADGWREVTEKILARCDPIVQFGIASARLDEKIELMRLGPDMMSYAFNVHDEFFQPDPAYPPNEMYALHPRPGAGGILPRAAGTRRQARDRVLLHGRLLEHRVHPQQGALARSAVGHLVSRMAGGAWTPPTPDALLYMVRHLPPNANWNCSVMNPREQWRSCRWRFALGGHVRSDGGHPTFPTGNCREARGVGRRRRCTRPGIGRRDRVPRRSPGDHWRVGLTPTID